MTNETYEDFLRESFDGWVSDKPRCKNVDRQPDGRYVDPAVQLAWEAWCVE